MLTARAIEALKPRLQQYERPVADPKLPGLAVRVAPSGAKSWSLRYRVNGRRLRRLTIGSYPTLSLADARAMAKAALREVERGGDPADAKRERRDADTVGELANRYIEEWARPRKRSWKEDERKLRVEILPRWRHRPAREITRRDVRELVEAIARRGAGIQANRVHALLHKVFAFAVEHEVMPANPATGSTKPAEEKQRDRVLTEQEIRDFWTATEVMAPPMRSFWRLRLVTAQRAVEVGSMKWTDIDLGAGWWTIPAGVAKNGLSHRVPLNAPAIAVLADLQALGIVSASYVLESARGKRQQSEAAKRIPIQDFRGHDLRRTAASYMASAGVPRLHIAKVLNHAESTVTAVYDRHSYDNEKNMAMDIWARRLLAVLERSVGGVVVPFSRS